MFPPFFSFGPVRDLKSGSALEVGGSWFKLSQAASGPSLGSSGGATSAGFLLTGVGVCQKCHKIEISRHVRNVEDNQVVGHVKSLVLKSFF